MRKKVSKDALKALCKADLTLKFREYEFLKDSIVNIWEHKLATVLLHHHLRS